MFEVVPWTHGYAHSWALRWMLVNDATARDRLLGIFVPEGKSPWSVENVSREAKVGRQRADLHFAAIDALGRQTSVLVETKVNDELKEPQIEAYCATSAEVIIYAPGLTGLLHAEADPIGRERWVTGRRLADALRGDLRLPDLIRSYLEEVAEQAVRMDAAREAARGGPDFDRADDVSEVGAADVEAVAWVAEVAAAMGARGARGLKPRNTPHDYRIFWEDSWQCLDAEGDLGLYVDIIAAHGGWEYLIAIKVGGGDAEGRGNVFDAAMRVGKPWEGWSKGRRRRSDTFRVWKLNVMEVTASEAADAALRTAEYLDAVTYDLAASSRP